ncbi:MAG: ABC transporter permease [Planctomycetaceae bacterium]|nr:ABC transporter permease [Planctomycetaceae bacterium]
MNLLTIAWKSICQRRLASALTSFSIALGVMMVVLVLFLANAISSAFSQTGLGYDLIVGPKGSDTQLVLSAVYRVQPPIENLPYLYLDQIRSDRRVERAVPLAFGDVTQEGSFPIVATTAEFFEHEYAPRKKFQVRKGGRRINDAFDAIIGAQVADQNQWNVGSQFTLVHGGADSGHVHDDKFTVVAVLAPTGTANDRTVFLTLEGFYSLDDHEKPVDEIETRLRKFYGSDPEMLAKVLAQLADYRAHLKEDQEAGVDHHDHDHHHHHAAPDAMREVSAILVRSKSDMQGIDLFHDLKTGYQSMPVRPVTTMNNLKRDVIGNMEKGLLVLTAMIIVVSGVSILVSIYNSMSDRRREIGIMRALGAGRTAVFSIILAESSLLCVGGGFFGWLLGHVIAVSAAPWLSRRTGLILDPWTFTTYELVLIPVMLILGALVGFLPAMTAYRTDVADALNH